MTDRVLQASAVSGSSLAVVPAVGTPNVARKRKRPGNPTPIPKDAPIVVISSSDDEVEIIRPPKRVATTHSVQQRSTPASQSHRPAVLQTTPSQSPATRRVVEVSSPPVSRNPDITAVSSSPTAPPIASGSTFDSRRTVRKGALFLPSTKKALENRRTIQALRRIQLVSAGITDFRDGDVVAEDAATASENATSVAGVDTSWDAGGTSAAGADTNWGADAIPEAVTGGWGAATTQPTDDANTWGSPAASSPNVNPENAPSTLNPTDGWGEPPSAPNDNDNTGWGNPSSTSNADTAREASPLHPNAKSNAGNTDTAWGEPPAQSRANPLTTWGDEPSTIDANADPSSGWGEVSSTADVNAGWGDAPGASVANTSWGDSSTAVPAHRGGWDHSRATAPTSQTEWRNPVVPTPNQGSMSSTARGGWASTNDWARPSGGASEIPRSGESRTLRPDPPPTRAANSWGTNDTATASNNDGWGAPSNPTPHPPAMDGWGPVPQSTGNDKSSDTSVVLEDGAAQAPGRTPISEPSEAPGTDRPEQASVDPNAWEPEPEAAATAPDWSVWDVSSSSAAPTGWGVPPPNHSMRDGREPSTSTPPVAPRTGTTDWDPTPPVGQDRLEKEAGDAQANGVPRQDHEPSTRPKRRVAEDFFQHSESPKPTTPFEPVRPTEESSGWGSWDPNVSAPVPIDDGWGNPLNLKSGTNVDSSWSTGHRGASSSRNEGNYTSRGPSSVSSRHASEARPSSRDHAYSRPTSPSARRSVGASDRRDRPERHSSRPASRDGRDVREAPSRSRRASSQGRDRERESRHSTRGPDRRERHADPYPDDRRSARRESRRDDSAHRSPDRERRSERRESSRRESHHRDSERRDYERDLDGHDRHRSRHGDERREERDVDRRDRHGDRHDTERRESRHRRRSVADDPDRRASERRHTDREERDQRRADEPAPRRRRDSEGRDAGRHASERDDRRRGSDRPPAQPKPIVKVHPDRMAAVRDSRDDFAEPGKQRRRGVFMNHTHADRLPLQSLQPGTHRAARSRPRMRSRSEQGVGMVQLRQRKIRLLRQSKILRLRKEKTLLLLPGTTLPLLPRRILPPRWTVKTRRRRTMSQRVRPVNLERSTNPRFPPKGRAPRLQKLDGMFQRQQRIHLKEVDGVHGSRQLAVRRSLTSVLGGDRGRIRGRKHVSVWLYVGRDSFRVTCISFLLKRAGVYGRASCACHVTTARRNDERVQSSRRVGCVSSFRPETARPSYPLNS